MGGTHFEQMAAEYAGARPPYPRGLFQALREAGAIGPGVRVLEVGAGAGLATIELIAHGCEVVAVEPGAQLSALLREAVPEAEVVTRRLEDADLHADSFDSVVAATSLHWVDLSVGLPLLHAALRPHGMLAVWRTIFGDDEVRTDFRDRVDEIVGRRRPDAGEPDRELRPTSEELAAGGWFESTHTDRWRWSIDLTTDQVRRLFSTFSKPTGGDSSRAGGGRPRRDGHRALPHRAAPAATPLPTLGVWETRPRWSWLSRRGRTAAAARPPARSRAGGRRRR